MSQLFEWPQYDKLHKSLLVLADLDAQAMAPVLEEGELILLEDNRKGMLSGQDKDGNAFIPVTYRTGVAVKTKGRRGSKRGKAVGEFHGFGPFAIGLHGNLTKEEYQKLDGPPLVPQGDHSRMIANYGTRSGQVGPGHFAIEGGWEDVVSNEGVEFLPAHFEGAMTGRNHKVKLPKRDARGVRPWGIEQMKKAIARRVDEILEGT